MRHEAEIWQDASGTVHIKGRITRGEVVVTDPYGTPRANLAGKHTGMDTAPVEWNPPDEDLELRPGEGWLEWVVLNGGRDANGGVGNLVQVRHPDDGTGTRLMHLREFSPRIQAWIDGGFDPRTRPYIEPDEVVGIMGNTGFVWGAGGAIPGPGDLATGRHSHHEHLIGNTAVDPLANSYERIDVVTFAPPPRLAPDPEPSPLELVGAFNEARLLTVLIRDMLDHPIAPADPRLSLLLALAAIEREARELVEAYGDHDGHALDEARALQGWAMTLATQGPQDLEYRATLERALDETEQIAHALRAAIPSAA